MNMKEQLDIQKMYSQQKSQPAKPAKAEVRQQPKKAKPAAKGEK
jgi:hypothetical protein